MNGEQGSTTAYTILALMLMTFSGAGAWAWQGNSYGKQLADLKANHTSGLASVSAAGAELLRAEQSKRRSLERQLAINDETHYKELTDAQQAQARLRDRLATSYLRLSVILDARPDHGNRGVPPGASAGGVVHGGARGQLDSAHAQRIVGITGDGDRGLIALAACQGYARSVSPIK